MARKHEPLSDKVKAKNRTFSLYDDQYEFLVKFGGGKPSAFLQGLVDYCMSRVQATMSREWLRHMLDTAGTLSALEKAMHDKVDAMANCRNNFMGSPEYWRAVDFRGRPTEEMVCKFFKDLRDYRKLVEEEQEVNQYRF